MFQHLLQLDENVFRQINSGWVNPAFDFFFRNITDFGLFEIPLLIAVVVAFILAGARFRYALFLAILAVLVADMLGQDLKILVERLRPFNALEGVRLPAGGGSSKSFSFPSNHAINMFAAMSVLAWELRKKLWLSLLCFLPAVAVAYSRVYVGVHYPLDVMGGALIGVMCSALIIAIDRSFPFVAFNSETRKLVLNWTGLSILLLIFATAYRYSVILREVIPMSPEECQYWDWSRRLDLSYYSKPPGIAWIIRFFTNMFGNTAFAIRAGAVTLSAGIGVITMFFTRDLFHNSRTTFFTLFTMNVIPLFAIGAIIFTTDTPVMFFWAACCYAIYYAFTRESRSAWYIGGVLFGLGLLCKYAMIYFLPCLGVFLIASKPHRFWMRRHEPYAFCLIGGMMFLPVLVWSWQHDWINFRHVAGNANLEGGFALKPGEVLSYILSQFGAITPLIFAAILFFTIKVFRRTSPRPDFKTTYLLSMAVPVFLMLLIKSVQGSVLANWAAPAYFTWVIFGVWKFMEYLDEAPLRASRVRRISYGVAGLAIPAFVFLLFHDRSIFLSFRRAVTSLSESAGIVIRPEKMDPAYTMIGYEELGEKISEMILRPNAQILRPGRTFLLTQRYQIAAALAFHVHKNPRVYTVNFGDKRMTQYDLWGSPGEDLTGWDAIYVTAGNGDQLEKQVAGSFRSVERIPPITFQWKGIPYREFTIYVCKGFSGDFPMSVKNPGKF